jgi:hypothetical protein
MLTQCLTQVFHQPVEPRILKVLMPLKIDINNEQTLCKCVKLLNQLELLKAVHSLRSKTRELLLWPLKKDSPNREKPHRAPHRHETS